MLEKILHPENWKLQPIADQLEVARRNSEEITKQDNAGGKKSKPKMWINSTQLLSPLSLYKYLKARFGPPNGFVMLLKDSSSDNLIHWQYSLLGPESIINIWGKTSGIEIAINTDLVDEISETFWLLLIKAIQDDYKRYGKKMADVQSDFEHWSLFINPFCRIEQVVKKYVYELEKLKLKEPSSYSPGNRESHEKYMKDLKTWIRNVTKAASLGTTIRMLSPVVAESFINLILRVFRKQEYANDERLYENLIRQNIDVRVKTLHLHCICFPEQINSDSEAFRNFQTLMNGRNDFLHGNIDPNKLIVEDVWFDERFIPLFKKDEGIIKKMLRNYCSNVEPERAIRDFQIISDLIELVLMSMDHASLEQFVQIMADQMPGINKKSKRLGVLFPSQYLAENYLIE